MHAHLRRPAHPVRRQRDSAQAVADTKQPGDQLGDPRRCPALIFDPAVRDRFGIAAMSLHRHVP
ncbi:hypothetical protein ACWCSH_44100, partial [Streptosporangium sp. NPDC001682]